MRAVCVTVRDPFRPLEGRNALQVLRPRRVRALAPKMATPFVCVLNGRPLLRSGWNRRLRDGDVCCFVALPLGGNGSDPLRMVLQLALIAATFYFAPYLAPELVSVTGVAMSQPTALAMSSMVIMTAGSVLINALVPPPKLPAAQLSADLAQGSPTYSVGAQGNSARIGQPIPEIFGRHLVYPDFAAMPYTEFAGGDQYLYELFVIGRGEYDIEAVRIEDTPVASFEEVQLQVVPPGGTVTLFPTRVITSVEVAGQELDYNVIRGPYAAVPAGTVADVLAIDVVLSRGLFYANDQGGLDARTVTFRVEAQAIDDDGVALAAWTVLGNETIRAASSTPIRSSYRYPVPTGRYQVRLTRTSASVTDTRVADDIAWAGLRAYLPGTQQYGDVTLLAIRIRATDNISAQAGRKVNVIVTRRLPVWDGSTWSAPLPTRNPAWALAHVARQRLADQRINLDALQRLATTAAARGDEFSGVFDSPSTTWEALSLICRSVRALPYLQGGRLQVFRDEPETLPVAMFGPRNISRASFKLTYKMASEEMADCVDVEYFDSGTWSWKTVRAALDGSTEQTVFQYRLVGVTSRAQAWREGRYMVACHRYRRRFCSFTTEMDGFIPSLGDCVAITHDVPRWGQAAEATAWDVFTRRLTVTEPLDWSAGGAHYLSYRRRNGAPAGPYRCLQTDDPRVIELADWTDVDPEPDAGPGRERSYIAFGPGQAQYIRARVLSVRPRGMYAAEVACVVESDYVHEADQGTPPTLAAWQLPVRNTRPEVLGLQARSSVGDVEQMILSWQPSPLAAYYVIEQSADGVQWTRAGEVTGSTFAARVLYGSATLVRVAAVGMTRGPWTMVAYALGADYMWSADAATLMWAADDSTLMWS